MKKMPWILKIVILFAGTITMGIIPALAFMWANYHFEPNVCWPNVYGGWLLVPMVFTCAMWGFFTLDYLERKLEVCGHKD